MAFIERCTGAFWLGLVVFLGGGSRGCGDLPFDCAQDSPSDQGFRATKASFLTMNAGPPGL